ncbi:MAG TPA: SPOR domain-containing protein [Burkholderiales bacterium]|nr:SPOR domain-containing protein [Burkholderiales bacterium]
MSRDYKTNSSGSSLGNTGSAFLLGLLVGLILGLTTALVVAWYVNKIPSPFVSREKPPPSLPGAESKIEQPAPQIAPKQEEKQAKATTKEKPRFDFYKILPGVEEPVTEKELRQAAKQPGPTKDVYFLQAGAFQNISEADNLKAKLALMGVEAKIQSATLADKGVWHRVRVGPYTNVDELNRMRTTLKQNGIDASLIKVHDTTAH